MSRIGKQIITIPAGVEVTLTESNVATIKGPLGTLTRGFVPEMTINIADGTITVVPKTLDKFTQAIWGTTAAHLKNMIEGVTKGFEKKMIIEGVGYKMAVNGNTLVLTIGFSHDVKVPIPEGIKVVVEKNNMSVSGIDKEAVGGFAGKVRLYKETEPYKGKGIRYVDEVVRRKQGKKSTA